MGTPEFAVPSLDKLLQTGYNIVGVITAPDKPAGRGLNLQQSAIKKFAVERGLKILQPEKLKAPEFLEELKSLQADLQVVVAFRMLPEVVWDMPPMGTINLHASVLPQYRGAAPINWAIINGEKETGVTTFKLQHQIDTGDILLQQKIAIGEDETAGKLHDRMKDIGSEIILKTVKGLRDRTLVAASQLRSERNGQTGLKPAPKIFTDNCRIDWNKNVDEVYNLIRGLSPHPAAFAFLNSKTLKVYEAKKEIIKPSIAPGNFETDKKTFLKFACTSGYINITELQLEGKKRMSVTEFLKGYHF
jgi:methionyl-tRNA formyltransferase